MALSFIWGHVAMCITTFMPIYEYIYPDDDVRDEPPARLPPLQQHHLHQVQILKMSVPWSLYVEN